MNDLYNNLSAETKKRLRRTGWTEQYLVDLMAYHAQQQETEESENKSAPLDLSEVCTEFLGTNEATAGEKRVSLSVLLSAVMKHPDLPERIYNTLGDELCETPDDFSERPEVIQASLDHLREREANETAS